MPIKQLIPLIVSGHMNEEKKLYQLRLNEGASIGEVLSDGFLNKNWGGGLPDSGSIVVVPLQDALSGMYVVEAYGKECNLKRI